MGVAGPEAGRDAASVGRNSPALSRQMNFGGNPFQFCPSAFVVRMEEWEEQKKFSGNLHSTEGTRRKWGAKLGRQAGRRQCHPGSQEPWAGEEQGAGPPRLGDKLCTTQPALEGSGSLTDGHTHSIQSNTTELHT